MFLSSSHTDPAPQLSTCKSQRSPYALKLAYKRFPPIFSSHKIRRGLSSSNLSLFTEVVNTSKSKFSKKLAEYDFPSSLIQEYLHFLSELPQGKATRLMHEELLSLSQNRSTALMALSSYRVWEASIKEIQRLSLEAASDQRWKTSPVIINEIISTLSDHSYCTLVLVENILAWQASLSIHSFSNEETPKFVVEEVVVLDSLLKSCDFLMDSELTFYFSFSISDPFLLSVARKTSWNRAKAGCPGTNFYKSRECNELFYLDINPEAMQKMKALSRWLIKKNFIMRRSGLKKVRKSTVLPSIKHDRTFLNTLAMELVVSDLVTLIMTEEVQSFFNLKLAEKICFHFWTAETVKMLKKLAKECFDQENRVALEAQRVKEENNNLSRTISADLIDFFAIQLLDLPESFPGLLESVRLEIQAENERKKLEIDSKVSAEISESLLSLADLTSLLITIATESEEDFKAFLQQVFLETQNLTESVYEDLMRTFFDLSELPEIVSEVHEIEESFFMTQLKLEESSKNAQNLLISSIFEAVVRNLVESVLNCLSGLCEEVLSEVLINQEEKVRESVKFRLETEKVVQGLTEAVVESFVLEKWLYELCRNMCLAEQSTIVKESSFLKGSGDLTEQSRSVERAEDYAMEVFTPGVHSPNEVSVDHSFNQHILMTTQSLPDDTPRPVQEFAKSLKKINKPSLQPLNEKPKTLLDALSRYHQVVHNQNEDLLFFDEELLKISELSWNSFFFWIICDKKISGLLVFSQDSSGVIVNHSSVINFLLLKDLLKHLPKLLESYEGSLKIRLKRKPSSLIEESLKKTGFVLTEDTEYFLMYQKKGKEDSNNFLIQVKNFTQIETGSELIQKTHRFSMELSEFGNLFNIVSLVHHILSEKSSTDLDENSENKLQEDLNEILSIVLFSSYPKIQNFSIKSQEIQASNAKVFTSSLRLNLNVLASFFSTIQESSFKFVKIPANRLKIRNGQEDCRMFIIETTDPDVSIFVYDSKTLDLEIEENLRISKTDLFYYVSGLLKSLDDPKEYSKDLLLPCFSKELEFNNLLMHGYRISAEEDCFVNDCHEKISIQFDYSASPNQSLQLGRKVWTVSSDFVFGIIESGIYEEIEIPLLVTRVRKADWKSLV